MGPTSHPHPRACRLPRTQLPLSLLRSPCPPPLARTRSAPAAARAPRPSGRTRPRTAAGAAVGAAAGCGASGSASAACTAGRAWRRRRRRRRGASRAPPRACGRACAGRRTRRGPSGPRSRRPAAPAHCICRRLQGWCAGGWVGAGGGGEQAPAAGAARGAAAAATRRRHLPECRSPALSSSHRALTKGVVHSGGDGGGVSLRSRGGPVARARHPLSSAKGCARGPASHRRAKPPGREQNIGRRAAALGRRRRRRPSECPTPSPCPSPHPWPAGPACTHGTGAAPPPPPRWQG